MQVRRDCIISRQTTVFFLSGAILLIASMALSVHAQDAPPYYQFKHFKHVGTVRFDKPDTLLIATISRLDVNTDGQWLITDELGKQVLLFDSTGTLLASLDASTCHPGFVFNPENARFGGNEYIFVQTHGNYWGYRFTTEGKCLGSMDRDFVAPNGFFDIDPAGVFYGLYDFPEYELRRMSPTGKTLGVFPLPPPKYPNASRRFAQGGIIADGTHLFYALVPEPEIWKLTLDGELSGMISKRSSWFRSPPGGRDFPPDVSQRLWATMSEWQNTTTPWSLFELTDQTLMIQYTNGDRGTGYQIFTKDGLLITEELGLDTLFIHGENGLAYLVYQPDLDSQGELPNPFIEIYQFVTP